MNTFVRGAGCLALGAVGGFTAWLVASPPGPTSRRPHPTAHEVKQVRADLERLERRVDELTGPGRPRASLEPGPSASPAADAAVAAESVPTGETPLGPRVAVLEERVAALERRGGGTQGPVVPEDLGAASSKDLDALARGLVQAKRYPEAERVLGVLLARGDLDDAQRVEMEMQLGYALRGAGRHAEAEARFVETLGRVGADTAEGAWAGFQAAWDRFYQRDPAAASAQMERSANATGASAVLRVHSLYNAANFARQAGDDARARVLLERLLDHHAQDIPAAQAHMKTQAEAWLKEIRGY